MPAAPMIINNSKEKDIYLVKDEPVPYCKTLIEKKYRKQTNKKQNVLMLIVHIKNGQIERKYVQQSNIATLYKVSLWTNKTVALFSNIMYIGVIKNSTWPAIFLFKLFSFDEYCLNASFL